MGGRTSKTSKIGVEVEAIEELNLDGVNFHKFFKARTKLRRGHQEWLPAKEWEIVERGDSVALLLHVSDGGPDGKGSVVLTRQFRPPLLNRAERPRSDYEQDALMLEAIAGAVKVDLDETPEQALARETLEEVGYELDPSPSSDPDAPAQIQKIATFFPSPGGSSEMISVYYAEATSAAKVGPGGGHEASGEVIEPIELPVDEFFDLVDRGEIHDSKILVGYAQFQNRVIRKRSLEAGGVAFRLEGRDPAFRLHLRLGDIRDIKDVDVWVNSENTLMEMDQLVGRSVSSAVRAGGAWIDKSNNLVRADYVADALRRKMEWRGVVDVGEVIDTTPGRLKLSNNVRRIYHVATVIGRIGQPVQAEPGSVPVCVTAALQRVCGANRNQPHLWVTPYRSAVLPLIGSGNGGLSVTQSIRGTVEGVKNFLSERPNTKLRDVHLSIFKPQDFAQVFDYLKMSRDGFALEDQ